MRDNSGTLDIEFPIVEDLGQYQCFATNKYGTVSSNSAQLQKRLAPYFVIKPESRIVATDESIKLYCYAWGEPTPSIQWFRNGKPFP